MKVEPARSEQEAQIIEEFMIRSMVAFSRKLRNSQLEILSNIPRKRRDPNQGWWAMFWNPNVGYQWQMRDRNTGDCYWAGLIDGHLVAESAD